MRWGALLSCAVFTACGIVLVAVGELGIGLMSILFFGVGGLALLVPALTRRGAGTVRVTQVEGEPGFLFAISRAKQAVVTVAGVAVTLASVLLAVFGNWILGLLGTVVFGTFAVIGLLGLRGERGLVLTPTRVVARFNGHAEIDWDDVAQAQVIDYLRTRILGISARDPALVRQSRGAWLSRINRRLLPVDVSLPADNFVGDAQRIVDTLALYRTHPARRARIGTTDELERITHDELR